MKHRIFILLFIFTGIIAFGQIPAGYYDAAQGLTGAQLKSALNDIIDGHHEFSYSEVWAQLKYTDEDPNNSNNVILLYSGWSYPKSDNGGGTSEWNREHTWAKSHGNFGTARGPGTDIHHLRPTDVTVNSKRGSLFFDNGGTPYSDPTCYIQSGNVPTGCRFDSDSWEPRDEVKGDVARMIFYMATRYEGEHGEVDLEMVDYIPSNNSAPLHGMFSTLMQWHQDDPVSAWEQRRNNRIYQRQGNRNPFIDHPEYADRIWGTQAINELSNTVLVHVYPNPSTTGQVHVRFNYNATDKAQMHLYNVTGQEIKIHPVVNDDDVLIKDLPRGLYILRINVQSATINKRILVQ